MVGWQVVIHKDLRLFLSIFLFLGGRVKYRGGHLMVWHVVIWSIWKVRNDVIFNGITKTTKEVEKKSILLA